LWLDRFRHISKVEILDRFTEDPYPTVIAVSRVPYASLNGAKDERRDSHPVDGTQVGGVVDNGATEATACASLLLLGTLVDADRD
jgi:hypothetical protein